MATTVKKTATAKKTTKTKVATAKLPEVEVVKKKKVVFLGSEAAPFIATGGLADVLGSLPKALAKNGKLEEAWGTGTAAVVSPIGQLFYEGNAYTVSNNLIGEVTQKLYDNLTGIQWCKIKDEYNWIVKVCNG